MDSRTGENRMVTLPSPVQVWVVVLELSLLVAVVVKLGWDIVVYRQSGRLPWVARHLCFWSVPGISTAR